jgi:hypothetical protein
METLMADFASRLSAKWNESLSVFQIVESET